MKATTLLLVGAACLSSCVSQQFADYSQEIPIQTTNGHLQVITAFGTTDQRTFEAFAQR
ncbi:hypothetical protein [Caballeronia pedi]|uniref:hypothetical protein n=1 Tax=Caballeronia pedi TaxID=1777141 RepID=UPI00135A94C4|nr:hypothetical protein [Caballeronia pedi]